MRRYELDVREIEMRCACCKCGAIRPGKTIVALNRGEMVIVIKAVPAAICEVCGEYYLDVETTEQVMARCEDAVRRGVEVEVVNFGQ